MTDTKMRPILSHDTNTAIDILTEAFCDDPVMKYFVSGQDLEKHEALRRKIIRALVKTHIAGGEPLFGLYSQEQLLGCAMVDARLSNWRKGLGLLRCLPSWFALPMRVVGKLNAYGAVSQSKMPKGASHFLVMVGMSNNARGKGDGGRFLRAIEAKYGAGAHWVLDTENPTNVGLYEHMGYKLYDEVALDDICIYKMNKPPVPNE